MAKTPRLKTKNASLHSRAARRAASPPDKTLKMLTEAAAEIKTPKHVSVGHYAGVSKRKGKSKPLSRAKRLRWEKGLERAEANLDQMEVKKIQSMGRGKKIKERSSAWEETNGRIPRLGRKGGTKSQRSKAADEDGWEDESEAADDGDEGGKVEEEVVGAVTALHVTDTGTPNRVDGGPLGVGQEEEEDEVL